MKLFSYRGYIHGEHVAGIVKANDFSHARQILKNTYDDYHLWDDKSLEEVIFDEDDVYEIYYG